MRIIIELTKLGFFSSIYVDGKFDLKDSSFDILSVIVGSNISFSFKFWA